MKQRELDVFLPPAEKPKSRLKTYAQRTVVAAAAGATAAFPNFVADVALPYNQSAAEELLSDAYKDVYGTPFARVHCNTSKYIAEVLPGGEGRRPYGRSVPFTDTVWLTNERCAALLDFSQSPPKLGHFDENDENLMFQTSAMWTAAHEGGHSFDGLFEPAEDKAECSASHNIAAMAVALGMSPDPGLVDQFTQYAVTLQRDLQMDMPDQYNFDNCELPAAAR